MTVSSEPFGDNSSDEYVPDFRKRAESDEKIQIEYNSPNKNNVKGEHDTELVPEVDQHNGKQTLLKKSHASKTSRTRKKIEIFGGDVEQL